MPVSLSRNEIQVALGSSYQLVTSGSNTFTDLWGSGSPESNIAAEPGSSYRDITNGMMYVKATGSGNTGWLALSTGLAAMPAVTVKANPTAAAATPTDLAVGINEFIVNTGGVLVSQKLRPHLNVEPSVVTLADGATISWDLADGLFANVTLGGNRTLAAPGNLQAGQTMILVVNQDGTGGRTLTWDAVFRFSGGTAPTLSTAANARDVFYLSSVDGTSIITSPLLDVQ